MFGHVFDAPVRSVKERIKADIVNSLYYQKDSAVIYNKFDIQSVFAAAAFSGRISPETKTKYQLVDSGSFIHADYDEYIWLNVNPLSSKRSFKKHVESRKAQQHRYFTQPTPVNTRPVSLFETCILNHLKQQQTPGIMSLGYMVSMFFSSTLTRDDLIFIYANYANAIKCIETNTVFVPMMRMNTVSNETLCDFDLFVKKVKSGLRNKYRLAGGRLNNKNIRYCLLSLSDVDYPWMIRIVQMTYKYYLNVSSGINGYIVDTNIPDLRGIKLVEEHTVSNSC